jgi:hypothetical protein
MFRRIFSAIALTILFATTVIANPLVHASASTSCGNQDTPRDYGPWENIDSTREYMQLSQRESWWIAGRKCSELGFRLPTWEEIASDYRYLKGTTPVLDNYRRDISRGEIPFFWTGDEDGADSAHKFSELDLTSGRNPNSIYKETRYGVLCVR